AVELSARSDSQLPFARLELVTSRAPWMTEPLPAAAIQWAAALTVSALPEREPYPQIHQALDGLLTAICHAPSARGWLSAMVRYETLLLRELGYGESRVAEGADFAAQFKAFRRLHRPIRDKLLASGASDVMAARTAVGERLARMVG
ncbi:MAG: DNA repair protein RecO C-terminal domain-containing protein, partial [Erythrobacter sp.]